MKKILLISSLVIMMMFVTAQGAMAWTPTPVKDDPLVRMPGTQPGDGVMLEGPGRCLNCHADYNHMVEPGFNWKGSMMAQASRDFLFWSCMTVSMQDAIWAVKSPNATDICIRCHFPIGWIEGRSDPTNASQMRGDDYDGVNCDFCHNLYDPFFVETAAGREGTDWVNYWDEQTTLSSSLAAETRAADWTEASTATLFNQSALFDNNTQLPVTWPTYTINAGGQYFLSAGGQKRSSYADAAARHQWQYSRYHKSKYLCSTCHDISNPILHNLGADPTLILPTESDSTYSYYHVERTFSEFMLSDYAQQGGAAGIGPFAPTVFETSFANNFIAKCQDCHLRDVVGVGCNKNGAPLRPNESTEHPESGLPLHDMTGGNAWVSWVLASAMPNSPAYNGTNFALLNQGPAVLTLDMTAGQSADPVALLAGVDRSKQQLLLGAAINDLVYTPGSGHISFKVQNQTGHKLISGFPEGRRMFVNIKAYQGGSLIYEVNPYDDAAKTLKGLGFTYSPALYPLPALPDPQDIITGSEAYVDELVYEAKTSSTLTGETKTFHFALATDRYKDNRIPPKGFRIGNPNDADLDDAYGRISEPKWGGLPAGDYFTAAEYAGGYDDYALNIAANADYVEVNLYYQTTSREYIEFLRDEINGTGNLTLYSPTPSEEPEAYIIQSDPFFAQLKGWGDTIWQLFVFNSDMDGAAPFLMTQAVYGAPPAPCGAPAPTGLTASPASNQVTLNWDDMTAGYPSVADYSVYYDQVGKSQFIASTGPATTFTDANLLNGQEYCYKVTSHFPACESEFSQIVCATPQAPGQTLSAGVDYIDTGFWQGKGKNQTFVLTGIFNQGDEIIFQAYVVDQDLLPVEGAVVDLNITGPTNTSVITVPSDAAGLAEGSWKTTNKGGSKTPLGGYTATTANVTATGYIWNGSMTATAFTIQ